MARITTEPIDGAPRFGVTLPRYAAGGPVTTVAPPKPPGPDDGYAALTKGEFVVKRPEAEQYAGVLQQINDGTYDPGDYPMSGTGSPPPLVGSAFTSPGNGQEPDGDAIESDPDNPNSEGYVANSDTAATPLMPSNGGAEVTPDMAMQNLATLPTGQRQILASAASDPNVAGALLAVLGPPFAPVLQAMTANGMPAGLPGAGQSGAPMPGPGSRAGRAPPQGAQGMAPGGPGGGPGGDPTAAGIAQGGPPAPGGVPPAPGFAQGGAVAFPGGGPRPVLRFPRGP